MSAHLILGLESGYKPSLLEGNFKVINWSKTVESSYTSIEGEGPKWM